MEKQTNTNTETENTSVDTTNATPAVETHTDTTNTSESDASERQASKEESELKRARKEAARYRTERNDIKTQYEQLTDTIGRAFGFIKGETTVEDLEAALNKSKAQTRQAQLELAVYRHAKTAGADPELLLDSTSFLKTVADVDLEDETEIVNAITSHVKQHKHLRATPQGGASTVEHSARSGDATPQVDPAHMTMSDLTRLYNTDKDAYRKAVASMSAGR